MTISNLLLASLIFCLSLPSIAAPQVESCTAKINNKNIKLKFNPFSDEYLENTTFREILFSGHDGSCPGFIALRHMTPKLSVAERETFCAVYDKQTKNYLGFATGARDAYAKCKKPGKLCTAVNASKEEALALVGLGAGATAGVSTAAAAAGVTAVTHSSGAVILTGSAGYLAGTLGTASASVVAALTAPAAIIGATVSVVAVGSAVYLCKPPK
ncbi:MAG: hypothetical protein EAZ11_04020 [Curvibacter sp.]|nr:MAG: hypothetical protein EAZ11_04020 [Curvibacter sp.]